MRLLSTPIQSLGAVCAVMACLSTTAKADTFLSGFEETPSDPIVLEAEIGEEWNVISGAVGLEYTTDGVTEGSQAIALTHNTGWTHALQLNTFNLIDHVRLSDTLEFDLTVNSFDADWRQVFVVMQGLGQGWSQKGIDLDVGLGIEEFATTNISIDLADVHGDGTLNWKAAAQAARESMDANNGDGGWWQIHLIFQGQDLTGEPQVTTIIDNIRLTGGPLPIDGDYNGDGVVDAADYTVWRDGGATGDYATWSANYAANIATLDPPVAVSVPEPTTVVSVALACLMACSPGRRRS